MSMYKYILLMIVACTLSGCDIGLLFDSEAIEPSDIQGTYMRETPALTETLFLKPDGIFEQEVVYKNGQKFTSKGTWKSMHRGVRIKNIYITVSEDRRRDIYPPKFSEWGTFPLLYGKDFLNGDLEGERPIIYFFRRIENDPLKIKK